MSALNGVLADLHDESEDLDRLVAALPTSDWATLTPAPGWTISHQIAHLAWTDEVSRYAVSDQDKFAASLAAAAADPAGFVDTAANASVDAHTPGQLLALWRRGRAELAATLAEVPDGTKIPWYGTRMSATSMATARLMETWAHGQDVADALHVERTPTRRLKHIAFLAVRTRDFAFGVHGMPVPDSEFLIELGAPDGSVWTWGPSDATNRVAGPALDFCLLATQRRNRANLSLIATGAEADQWLDIAQAFAGPPGQGRTAQ